MPDIGFYRLRPRCFLSGPDAVPREEITDAVMDGEVAVDVEAEVPSTFTASLLDPDRVPAWSWVRPYLTITWYDPAAGNQTLTEPLGNFLVGPPAERHSPAMGTATIDGTDGCWVLKQGSLEDAVTFAAGANVVDAITGLVAAAGFTKIHIPARSNTFPKKRHYDAGTSRLEVINELLHRIAYHPLWFDRHGVAMSRRILPRHKVEPRRTIASGNGDVVRLVELETDAERLCNRVTVTGNDPTRDAPIVVTKTNRRADSPASVQNLGFVKARAIEGSNVDTVAEATDLANKALEDGASVERRVRLATIPDPGFAFHETIRLAIERDDGTDVASGLWWWSQLRIGFAPAQMPQEWTMNKLVPYSDD